MIRLRKQQLGDSPRPAARERNMSTACPCRHGLASFVRFITVALLALAAGSGGVRAEGAGSAIAPRPLVDLTSADAAKQMRADKGDPTIAVDKTGIALTFPGSPADYPGVMITPATGKAWDLSPFGHIEAKVTNTGDKPMGINLRVDGESWKVTNTESVTVKPGESKVLKVIFGYQFGFKEGPAVKSATISELLFFLSKSDRPRSFRIEDLQAAGAAGEKPPLDPNAVVTKPENGVILGKGVAFDVAKQVEAGGAQVSAGPEGTLAVNFAGGKEETLKIKPVMGAWNLTEANQIRVAFKNVGHQAVTPTVVVGPAKVPASAPIEPGAAMEIAVSFIPAVSGVGVKELKGMYNGLMSGTGTGFESEKVKGFSILSDKTPGPKSLLITSIIADAITEKVPEWVGKKPPVDGDWVQTFAEEFDGPALDYKKWNIYGNNYWDGRTHFSKDNAILKNGKMIFHYEKKTGRHNDAENGKQTDYACGFLCTYGKWTQRYGYFESRMKLPKASGLWPAFWLMPDRGKALGEQWKRASTGKLATDTGAGGAEFDIMEFLSGWGRSRFNVALHMDGYGKEHKSVGSQNNYVRADQDGYITTGLLWTPGVAVIYNNGKEIFRWENARVSDVQSYLMYDMVSGGWANTRLEDSQLPDDFYIDYVRVWQRKDLASPADGPKPNTGNPDETKN